MVRYSAEWYGTVRCGVVRCDVVLFVLRQHLLMSVEIIQDKSLTLSAHKESWGAEHVTHGCRKIARGLASPIPDGHNHCIS